LDDRTALTVLLAGSHVERKERSENMETEEFNHDNLAADILEAHERELFDDELDALS
jgi:hypothetical protein